jgi:ribose transport system ATP-binding protein
MMSVDHTSQLTGVFALEMRRISKSFGPTQVLRDVDFQLRPGEVHALMGENGAGKSTLMKIASGLIQDFEGQILVGGQPIYLTSPRDAARAGIAMIHQELSLVPELEVDENIFLGQEKLHSLFLVDRKSQMRAAEEVLKTLDFQGPLQLPVSKLRVGEQQLVEIGKALVSKARILIMDEATSALSINETERLFQVIRRLAAEGVAIVYISHRMEEVTALADTVTVLRDGRHIGTVPAKGANRKDLIRMMVGREIQEMLAEDKDAAKVAKPMLEVRSLSLEHPSPTPSRPMLVRDVNFAVGAGEVFGLGGLLGAGRTEILQILYGLHPGTSGGQILIEGEPVQILSPLQAKARGLALVTEDRKRDGLVLGAGIARNIGLPVMRTLTQFGVVLPGREKALAQSMMQKLNIHARDIDQTTGSLSGGNQQKVVVAKCLVTKPKVFLLDEPTRGIDVGAKAEIYRLIRDLADQGLAMVLVSSELPELMLLSDRMLVLREGRPTALLDRLEFSQETILEYASPGGAIQPEFMSLEATL